MSLGLCMTDITPFLLAWAVYGVAGTVFYALFWRMTRFRRLPGLGWYLRALMLAAIATPWYVSSDSALLAPAIIVLAMDAITISGSAAVRAFVPLLLSHLAALVLVTVGLLLHRSGRKPQQVGTESLPPTSLRDHAHTVK